MRTEETILRSVDHPYLAKLYATLQTGAQAAATPAAAVWGSKSSLLGACMARIAAPLDLLPAVPTLPRGGLV